MNRKIIVLMVLSFFSFLNALRGQTKSDIPITSSVGESAKIDRIARKLIRKKKLPGLAITCSKNGDVIWQKGYGYANIEGGEAVNAKTSIFRVASVSKPLAATALAKMVEQNQIDLDASLYKYLPDFPKKQYDFTIRQLGGHLAGIRSYKGNEFLNNKPLSIEEGVSLFADDKLLFEPGTEYFYNSYDWVLISAAMQKIAKMPFETYVKENVLVPLKMDHTFPDTNRNDTKNMVTFYSRKGQKEFRRAKEVNNFFKLAGGGFLSTTDDICKLGNAYLNEGFLDKTTVKEFLSGQQAGGKNTYYGIGWEVSLDDKKRPYVGHTGNGVGGYALFRIYPAQRMVFAIFTNMTGPDVTKEFNAIIDEIMDYATLR